MAGVTYRRPLQLELGQHLSPEGYRRGDPLDAGQRLRFLPFGARRAPAPAAPPLGAPAAPHPDLFAPTPSFDLAAWLKHAKRIRHTRHRQATARTQLTPALIAACEDLAALHQLAHWLGKCELAAIADGRARQLDAIQRRGHRTPGPRLDPARIPTARLQQLAQQHRDLAVVNACRQELRQRLA
jgi:hypothetical protein